LIRNGGKSLKSNAALAKSPTRTVMTLNNHVFMAIFAVFKLECLKMRRKLNHFALRTKCLSRQRSKPINSFKRYAVA